MNGLPPGAKPGQVLIADDNSPYGTRWVDPPSCEACERFTWRPIETAPKDGTDILGAVDGIVVLTRWELDPEVDDEPGWMDTTGPDPIYECFRTYKGDKQPTHWMPLPEPPK